MSTPNWFLNTGQPPGSAPAPVIEPLFILPRDLSASPSGYNLNIIPSVAVSIRNRMSRILLFEFRATNGAILPVVVDPGTVVDINVEFSLVQLTVYDPTQFLVGQAPSSTHFTVPFGQIQASRYPDTWAYMATNPAVASNSESSGGYALVVISDQPIDIKRSYQKPEPIINAVGYTDVATSGLVPATFDANIYITSTVGILAANVWQGFHAMNRSSTLSFTVKYKENIISDPQITVQIPPLTIVSLPVQAYEFIVTFTDTTVVQAFWALQEVARNGAAQP